MHEDDHLEADYEDRYIAEPDEGYEDQPDDDFDIDDFEMSQGLAYEG